MFSVELLHSDHEGGQWTVSRFIVVPVAGDDGEWKCSVVRHWNLEGQNLLPPAH